MSKDKLTKAPEKAAPEPTRTVYAIGRGRQYEGGTVVYVLDLPESVFKAHIRERRQPNLRSVALRELDRELQQIEERGQWEAP